MFTTTYFGFVGVRELWREGWWLGEQVRCGERILEAQTVGEHVIVTWRQESTPGRLNGECVVPVTFHSFKCVVFISYSKRYGWAKAQTLHTLTVTYNFSIRNSGNIYNHYFNKEKYVLYYDLDTFYAYLRGCCTGWGGLLKAVSWLDHQGGVWGGGSSGQWEWMGGGGKGKEGGGWRGMLLLLFRQSAGGLGGATLKAWTKGSGDGVLKVTWNIDTHSYFPNSYVLTRKVLEGSRGYDRGLPTAGLSYNMGRKLKTVEA